MSFWKTSAGQEATGEVKENNFDPLPKDWYTSMLESVEVDEYQGQKKIKIKARVVEDGEYNNRILFLNLKAFEGPDIKETTRDNAIQMLVKMFQVAKAKLPNGEPDDRSLSQLIDKPMDLFINKWKMKNNDGEWMEGNNLANVAARGEKAGEKSETAKKMPNKPVLGKVEDDIPF